MKAWLSPLVDVVIAVGIGPYATVGPHVVLTGRITPGVLVVYVLYLGKMYKPIKDLSKTADTMSKAAVSFERIGELLAIDRQVTDRPGAATAHRFDGRIALEHVRFGYAADRPVLKDVSLTVAHGQRAAIVGETGAGKSTLMALIARLYDVQAGALLIDGIDVRDYTLDCCASKSASCSRIRCCSAPRSPTTSRTAGPAPRVPRSFARDAWHMRMNSSRGCRTDTTR